MSESHVNWLNNELKLLTIVLSNFCWLSREEMLKTQYIPHLFCVCKGGFVIMTKILVSLVWVWFGSHSHVNQNQANYQSEAKLSVSFIWQPQEMLNLFCNHFLSYFLLLFHSSMLESYLCWSSYVKRMCCPAFWVIWHCSYIAIVQKFPFSHIIAYGHIWPQKHFFTLLVSFDSMDTPSSTPILINDWPQTTTIRTFRYFTGLFYMLIPTFKSLSRLFPFRRISFVSLMMNLLSFFKDSFQFSIMMLWLSSFCWLINSSLTSQIHYGASTWWWLASH